MSKSSLRRADERSGGGYGKTECGGGTPMSAWMSLVAVALGIMVVQIDGTVVSIANPAIAADLGAGLAGIQWVTTGYLLVLAGLVIPAGTVADKIGRKKAFLIGVGGFSLASLVCGLSGSIEMLIGARVLQAIFAALLAPAGLAVLRAAFPPEKLAMALGWFGSVSAVALAGGPLLGGFLVEYASWPWVFFINLPVGVVGVVIGMAVIRESGERGSEPLDIPGAATLTFAMVSVVWAITRVQASGLASADTIGFLLLGLVLLGVFIAIERKTQYPMAPLELFRDRSFSVGVVVMVATMLAFFAILFYLTFFLQGVQGKGGIGAAVALLPLTAVFTVASPVAGWVTGKLGTRGTLVLGAICTAGSLALLTRIGVDSSVMSLAPSLVLAGFGAGFMMVPAIGAIVGSAPVDKAGVASGVQQSMQQLGSTLGVAMFGGILASAVGSRFPGAVRDALGDGSAADRIAGDEQLRQSVEVGFSPAAQQGLGQQMADAGMAPDQARQLVAAVTEAAHETFIGGLHTVFIAAAGAAVAAGLLSLLIHDTTPKEAESEKAGNEGENLP